MNEVFILEIYDPEDDYAESSIIGVFNTRENAAAYRLEYIRDRYEISEEDCSDEDLLNDIYPVELNINRFRVIS